MSEIASILLADVLQDPSLYWLSDHRAKGATANYRRLVHLAELIPPSSYEYLSDGALYAVIGSGHCDLEAATTQALQRGNEVLVFVTACEIAAATNTTVLQVLKHKPVTDQDRIVAQAEAGIREFVDANYLLQQGWRRTSSFDLSIVHRQQMLSQERWVAQVKPGEIHITANRKRVKFVDWVNWLRWMRCTPAAAGFREPHKSLAHKKGWGAGAPWLVGRGEDIEDILRMLAGFSNEQWGRVMNTLHATCVDKGLHYIAPDLMHNVCTALAVA